MFIFIIVVVVIYCYRSGECSNASSAEEGSVEREPSEEEEGGNEGKEGANEPSIVDNSPADSGTDHPEKDVSMEETSE